MKQAICTSLDWVRGLRSFDELDPKGYRIGYLALIDLFATYVRPADYQTVVGGGNAVYGWMPTIFRGVSFDEWMMNKDTLASLAAVKNWREARPILFAQPGIMSLISGSVVGTSKFLHFLNPAVFPIWDTNIRLTFQSAAILPVNQPSSYLTYGDALSAALPDEADFSSAYLDFVGQDVSAVRRLELALFLHGRHLRAEQR